VDQLQTNGAVRASALARLHDVLLGVARAEVRRRAALSNVTGPELDDLAHQATDDALLAIIHKLDSFRGDSRFTTWAYRFVILEVAGKMTRHAWRKAAPVADTEDWGRLPDRFGFSPADALEWRELFSALRRAADEELSDRQRRVFAAIVLQGVPLDVLSQELDTNRNAIYKTLFDARRKLRSRLVNEGYLVE
jgi:RNA polymerase sigma-70 factor (ECF subfamily)